MRRGVMFVAASALLTAACFDIPSPLELPETGGGGGGGDLGGAGGGGEPTDCAFVDGGDCVTVVRVEAGGLHSCAVLSDDSLRCWGDNTYGQLGDPSFRESNDAQPRIVPGIHGVSDIALGYHHTCVLLERGETWCWGRNTLGQVGNGITSDDVREPSHVGLTDVTAIDARFSHTCAVRNDEEIWCWGFALDGQGWQGGPDVGAAQPTPVEIGGLQPRSTIGVLSSGGAFACVANGSMDRVACWGNNGEGALGDGTLNDSTVAVGLGGTGAPLFEKYAALASGSDHACSLSLDRHIIACWGSWSWVSPPVAQLAPSIVATIDEAEIVALGGGWRHTCLLLDNGEVRCWGDNIHLQLGVPFDDQPRLTPVAINGLPSADVLAVGRNHGCVVARDGTLWCWGRNDAGQLGSGLPSGPLVPVPVAW
jgi:alpha-tubulin suppressor-like RCC1 family protein